MFKYIFISIILIVWFVSFIAPSILWRLFPLYFRKDTGMYCGFSSVSKSDRMQMRKDRAFKYKGKPWWISHRSYDSLHNKVNDIYNKMKEDSFLH